MAQQRQFQDEPAISATQNQTKQKAAEANIDNTVQ
jgi:hypothetical protein